MPTFDDKKSWLHAVDCVKPNKTTTIIEWEKSALEEQRAMKSGQLKTQNNILRKFVNPNITVNGVKIKEQKRTFKKDITLDASFHNALFGKDTSTAEHVEKIKKCLATSGGIDVVVDLLWRTVRKSVLIKTIENEERLNFLLTVLHDGCFDYQISWVYNPNTPADPSAEVILEVFLVQGSQKDSNDKNEHYFFMQRQDESLQHTNNLPQVNNFATFLSVKAKIATRNFNFDQAISSSSSSSSSSDHQPTSVIGLVVESLVIYSDVPNLSIIPGQAEQILTAMVESNRKRQELLNIEECVFNAINKYPVRFQPESLFSQIEVSVDQATMNVSDKIHSQAGELTVTGDVFVLKYLKRNEWYYVYTENAVVFPYNPMVIYSMILPKGEPSSSETGVALRQSLMHFTATLSVTESSQSNARASSIGFPKTKKIFAVDSIEVTSNFPQKIFAEQGKNAEDFNAAQAERMSLTQSTLELAQNQKKSKDRKKKKEAVDKEYVSGTPLSYNKRGKWVSSNDDDGDSDIDSDVDEDAEPPISSSKRVWGKPTVAPVLTGKKTDPHDDNDGLITTTNSSDQIKNEGEQHNVVSNRSHFSWWASKPSPRSSAEAFALARMQRTDRVAEARVKKIQEQHVSDNRDSTPLRVDELIQVQHEVECATNRQQAQSADESGVPAVFIASRK